MAVITIANICYMSGMVLSARDKQKKTNLGHALIEFLVEKQTFMSIISTS